MTDEGYTLYLLFVLTWKFGCKYFFKLRELHASKLEDAHFFHFSV